MTPKPILFGKNMQANISTRLARRLLILRPDNLGDIVLFSGTLRHIREHYQQAEITLCVKRYVYNLLELCPYIDRIICWEDVLKDMSRHLLQWLPSVRGRGRLELWLRQFLVKLKYRSDILLLPVRSPDRVMHSFVNQMHARFKYGITGDFCNQSLEKDRAADAIYTAQLQLPPERQQEHEFFSTREYLRLLGIEVTLDNLWPEFWTDTYDRQWAKESIPQRNGEITLAVCPATTNTIKLYPITYYIQIFKSLPSRLFNVVIFGSKSEKDICKQVAYMLSQCNNISLVQNLSGQTTPRQLVEGLRRCTAVLTLDSAALHIGVALRKPVVGIMGGGHYGRFYPWGNPLLNRVVNMPMDCYWCNWQCKYDTIRCIQEIPPQMIARELEMALRTDPILESKLSCNEKHVNALSNFS